MSVGAKTEISNVIRPGSRYRVDTAKYEAMRDAVLAVLPAGAPGLTVAQLHEAVLAHLPQDLYPGGAKSGWWTKAVQLDLEARGVIRRERVTPLRLHRV